ncbi:beta-galactosidase [Arachidicoccus sp.]|uniref:glycoside hydrolase family 35 protein n=1 Tax=Arachidicoccus sp. TaxID=1872624 RepID=UPI003D254FE8
MKKFVLSLIAIITLCCTTSFAQKAKHTFEIKNGSFLYDGKPIQIHSGEMHYARVPHQYWRQRLEMLKAMGLNTVATYVFWNYVETAPGVWDFTGDHDLARFVKTAQDVGLMVILRPGPYACAEWEFGGFPWWLQKTPGMVLRTDNKPFLDSCDLYINKLAEQVRDLQITKGGPIIMVQAENEFGSYVAQRKDIPLAQHKAYSATIKADLLAAGFDVPLFTADGSWLFKGGTIDGVFPTANGEDNIDNLKKAVNQYHNGEGPYMVAEFYPGWLDHWAEPFPKTSATNVAKQTKKYLENNISFNFYMVHGGTNFGFTSGANYSTNHPIQPDMTSYDYDAPISEAGWATPKYDSIRAVMKQYVAYSIPSVPKAIPVIAIPSIHLNKSVDLFKGIIAHIQPVVADTPMTFEDLNQGYGYVLYRKHFTQPINGTLDLKGLRDYALIYVNGKKVGELNRQANKFSMNIDIPFNATLDILVENMGRINYGSEIIHNLKGIISPVTIEGNEITGDWEMYKLPMSETPDLSRQENSYTAGNPVIYEGSFKLSKVGDTFLDMSKWGKGIIFVNGHNLGRYWKVGPQQTLYLPGCWLNKGNNTIEIFEQQNDVKQTEVSGVITPILDKLNLPQEDKK